MKNLYLLLAILGYLLANPLMLFESWENGNILLWTKPSDTLAGLFANRISTIFAIDLFFAVLVFFIWSHREARRLGMRRVWIYWLLTMLFGLAGTLPLFLWQREKRLSN